MKYDNKKFNIIVIIAKIRIFTNMESSMAIREAFGGGAWRSEAGCGAGLGLKGFVFWGTVGWYGVRGISDDVFSGFE
jgi:hypothetical protein